MSKSSTVLFRYSPWRPPLSPPPPHSNALQYYVKREKCKVNDVIFPSGCETRAINLDKNLKIGIFTGGTSVGSKNVFTAISRYPTGKHGIITCNRHYQHYHGRRFYHHYRRQSCMPSSSSLQVDPCALTKKVERN